MRISDWSSDVCSSDLAAALLGLPAVIVMPSDAPAIKVANTRGYGAEVIFYDRLTEAREEIGAAVAAERGATLVRPYDDVGVIAGQGTCGLEVVEQAEQRHLRSEEHTSELQSLMRISYA